jgi:hypothetical protein
MTASLPLKNKYILMKKIILMTVFMSLLNTISYSQSHERLANSELEKTVHGFLNWYKAKGNELKSSPIVLGFNKDSIKKDSIVRIDMPAVEEYLKNLKKSNYVSEVFLNNLREIYKNVSDTLVKHPVVDYFGPVPGLESDLIFGFEPEEILDHIREGRFTKIYVVYDKAIIKFDISDFNQYIFTLTKLNGRWLIDYFGLDRTNFDKMNK